MSQFMLLHFTFNLLSFNSISFNLNFLSLCSNFKHTLILSLDKSALAGRSCNYNSRNYNVHFQLLLIRYTRATIDFPLN